MAEIDPAYFCELPRYAQLSRLRRYFTSKQYEGRPDFFTGLKGNSGGEPVPLRERKPCIIYPLPKNAVGQVVRFTFGESRFPKISVEEVTTENSVTGETLSKEDAETLEKFIAQLIERCELKPGMRRIMRPGLATGTSCVMLSIEDGIIKTNIAQAEDVLAQFKGEKPGNEVLRAVWAYQYQESVPGPQGKPESKRFWFRQDFDAEAFTEYERTEVVPNQKPEWRVARVVKHGFGFCPVFWIRNIGEEDAGHVDGVSLYDGLFEEFDALNFALSQRHRGINFFGVPQPWETGVEEDDGPVPDGRVAKGENAIAASPYGRILGADGRRAVKAGPDHKWTYRGKDTKLGLLETTGKAFEAGSLHVNDIRARALESMSVVLVNVSEIMGRTQQGQMSAKFLELAYEPLLALVDEMRHCWWPHGLQAVISGMLRIVVAKNGEGIYIPGAKNAAAILKRFLRKDEKGAPLWMPPNMTPAWGDYFAAGPEEIAQAIDAATKAKDAHLVPEADASKYVLHYFGREDEQEALEEIEEDKTKAAEEALTATENEAKVLHAQAAAVTGNAKPKPAGGGSRGKSAKAPAGGGGSATASAAAKE